MKIENKSNDIRAEEENRANLSFFPLKIAAVLAVVGAILIAAAYKMQPYTDEYLFKDRYLSLSPGQTEEYWRLRDEMLTPKYFFQDLGITCLVTSVVWFVIARRGISRVTSPSRFGILLVLAIGAPMLTTAGNVFDLFQAYKRGEYPHWADSVGIPLMGAPLMLLLLLLWSLSHVAVIRKRFVPNVPLSCSINLRMHPWFVLVSVMTAIFLAWSFLLGQYWYVIPGILWLYFYLSMGAIILKRRLKKQ